MKENRTILLGGQQVPYLLTRRKSKNIHLRVMSDGQIRVSASKAVPIKVIEAFMTTHVDFVLKHFERAKTLPKPEAKRYVDGETFDYLGEQLTLQVIEHPKQAVFVHDGRLVLATKYPDDPAKKEKQVQDFYTEQARVHLTAMVDQIYPTFEKLGIAYPTLKFRRMKSQWGSCMPNKGQINLNTRLMEHPKAFIEYVILHEFCHFIVANHSKDFYHLVERLMPDWKVRSKLVKKI